MVQVDLITGFLGSGKTTFMRHYARYMVQQGWNVCILENVPYALLHIRYIMSCKQLCKVSFRK